MITLAVASALPAQVEFRFLDRTVTPDPGTYPGGRPVQLVDLNADRYADIVTPTQTYLFTGSAAFAPPVDYIPPLSGLAYDPAVGDVDCDGWLDLLAPNTASDTKLFRGDGQGNWTLTSGALPSLVDLTTPFAAELFDIDFDGDLDALVITIEPRGCPLLINDGSGHFVHDPSRSWAPLPNQLLPIELQAVDLDGDGDLDLALGAAANQGYGSRIYVNDGAGNFQLRQEFVSRRLGFHLEFGDVDGDGDADLVQTGLGGIFGYERPALWLNDGAGNFTIRNDKWPHQDREQGAALGDVDGDGDLDIVAGYYESMAPAPTTPGEYPAFALWLNDGAGNFTDAHQLMPTVSTPLYAIPAVELGDLDGDGDLDIVTGFGSAYFWGPTHMEVLWNTKRHLYPPQEPHLGQTYALDVWADAGHTVGVFLAFQGARFDLGALGVFGLDPATTFTLPGRVVPPARTLTYRFPISNDPTLLGLTLHWQAIDVDSVDLTKSRLTAKYEDTILP